MIIFSVQIPTEMAGTGGQRLCLLEEEEGGKKKVS